ncbi:uncharacterized protein LOC123987999 [Osmia bicornis bicornis]|uniref:uncharacterized protein LOC123987999 n=2 Tax=Osmia bicornis bicornis TaxID=1437191 RepID=UPI001EAEBD9F|nr:uncharacterized protein LOC123987999 [Osmia bicornis bicornis]
MAPTALKRLITVQYTRLAEIELSSSRLRDKDRSTFNRNIIASRIESLQEIWKDVRSAHADISIRDEAEGDAYLTDNVIGRLQSTYEDTLDFLLTVQAELEAAEQPTLPTGPPNASSSLTLEHRAAKLPKLDLPTFSGQYEDWENFCDLFTSLVHNAPGLADASRLQYLKTCLKGAAADLVKDVTTTNANYSATWQALKARFHNPRLIVYKHLRALLDMPYLKKESATELRSFADEAQRIVRALTNLQMPVGHWDIWFVYILAARLDSDSQKAWETELSVRDRRMVLDSVAELGDVNPLDRFPKFADLSEFLEKRVQALSMVASNSIKPEKGPSAIPKTVLGSRRVFHAVSSQPSVDGKPKCPLCTGAHWLAKCYKFQAKRPFDRRREVRRLQLCYNCFGRHRVSDCRSSFRCTQCKERHHSMIHLVQASGSQSKEKDSVESQGSNDGKPSTSSGVNVHTARVLSRRYTVLLATAQLTLEGPHGARTRVRALLDQGSQGSFISESVANLLGLRKRRVDVPLMGLGAKSAGTACLATSFKICSLVDPLFQLETEALILSKLTSQLPARHIMELDLGSFAGLSLADPQFYIPGSVDVIFGADIYGQLLRSGLRSFPPSSLIAQETVLGWIVSGPVRSDGSRRAVHHLAAPLHMLHCTAEHDLDESLQRFWNLEDLPAATSLKPLDEACERLFRESHGRNADGRFIVRLPLKSEPPAVGPETRRMAIGSLAHMYRRFDRDSRLASAYREFMSVYESLGHMERVPASELVNSRAWYLPHHAVVQSTPSKWKIRVVFDASRKTREGQCLNDFLLPGPALQRDLSLILLNWRRYRFVFTADVVKMFRQICVARVDQDLQRIVWAPSSSETPVEYRLTTVTYGTACAPYLAIRTLLQLAEDEKSRFPLGAQCLIYNTYVDDTFSGADELAVAVRTRRELIDLLKSAGVELDKWAANHADLLPGNTQQSGTEDSKSIGIDESVKTLGVQWNPNRDEFRFTTLDFKGLTGAVTKRSVLSNIARLFDPLGWLAPITITAKILMQDLWILKIGWDSVLPLDVQDRWRDYCSSLSILPALPISRWLGASCDSGLQIHGFSDASSRAYAAAIYIRIHEGNGRFRVSLLSAKSKVAPVKTVSIPNLELCGAVLLVKLLCHVRKLDFLQNLPVFTWSDSQIVLTWLRKHPCHWKTFVANRVSFIQTELPSAIWAHVPTNENPADLASRGSKPADLIHANLWWHGPDWLAMPEEHWPKAPLAPQVLHVEATPSDPEILCKFSTLTRLTRVVAFCLRPLVSLRRRKDNLSKLPDFLTTSELSAARIAIVKLAQAHAFDSEIKLLQMGKSLPKRNPLLSLNPFVDKMDGVLRVGGRLANSSLSHDRKHPPILPRRSPLSRLFVRHAHRSCLHGGPTLTMNTVLQYAWILGRTRLVKTEIRQCVTCQRVKPRLAWQMMGNLPATRITPARPFSSAGLDYAGPFQVRTAKGRGYKCYKGYIALFVCFTTRAIHLEAVSDLTTRMFLAAYRRFAGRRGVCRNLYSDNATTFQAADKELRAMFIAASDFYKSVAATLANDGTTWTFIPPNSPHYGGLWEAGVKSVKHHLKRAIGDRPLTFEEFSTVLVEIEACLNSRPLCPLNADIEDLQALTPAHFLGVASGLVPDESPPDVSENRLERFQLLQSIRNNFWKKWSEEYLQHLQERSKWRGPTENFAVGQLVLVRDDRYPPSKWPLGRVTEVHLGPDGLVRVVTVRTATSCLKRHVARLCPLWLERSPSKPAADNAII